MNPTLRPRTCDAIWACAVCPRAAAITIVTDIAGAKWIVVLCGGCARGFVRVDEAGITPAQMRSAA